ncbi:hypothetical protein ACIRD4_35310 [Streptomyces clavifer]|uniref:hypothetical protein n=1 Tax=Streptomyces clavifer TaxID=68188 RepID=UPI0037F587C6
MTSTSPPCVPTPFLHATIASWQDRRTVPDVAARCGQPCDDAGRLLIEEETVAFWELLRELLLGTLHRFRERSVGRYTVHREGRHVQFVTELRDSAGASYFRVRLVSHLDVPARVALLLVLCARNAAIEGDHAAVDVFARDVLGIARPELCRDGVIAALLGDWVHRLGCSVTDPELLRILHDYTAAERRRWRPLWERRANGGRVWLTGAIVAEGITLDDVLPEHRTPEDLALHHQLEDERVRRVLRGLTPDEAAVAARWAQGAGTWAESALGAGLPAAYGERVRRKLHRLGARQAERAAAAGAGR